MLLLECAVSIARRGPAGFIQSFFSRAAELQYEAYEEWTSIPNLRQPGRHVGPDGFRIVPYDKPPKDNARKVFILGGSAVFGTTNRDSETVPAYLGRSLGPEFRVFNLGEGGFNSVQELNRLMRVLALGNIPNIVIFYDGFNDVWNGVVQAPVIRGHMYLDYFQDSLFEGNMFLGPLKKTNLYHLSKWVQARILPRPKEEDRAADFKASRVVDLWLENMRMAKAICDQYGIQSYFIWQPSLYLGHTQLHEKERAWFNAYGKEDMAIQKGLSEAYKYAADRFARLDHSKYPKVYDFTGIFDQETEAIYTDFVHVTPKGNEIIARNIALIILK